MLFTPRRGAIRAAVGATLGVAVALVAAIAWASSNAPYAEVADARADIAAAQQAAAAHQQQVLLVFGANWCGDCRALDDAFHTGTVAPQIKQRYQVVKVNVGKYDRNLDLAEQYRVPLKKGIPSIAILSADGKALYSTQRSELASARGMGDKGLHDFFKKLAEQVR